MKTAQAAWQELNAKREAITAESKPRRFSSLYKTHPEMVYRAGVFVEQKPKNVPAGLTYSHFEGGDYLCFTLKGSYAQLPEACGRVFEIVKTKNLPVRDDFFIENYVNDPKVTAEEDLITEILIPTK